MSDPLRDALRAHVTDDPEALGTTHTTSAAHGLVMQRGEVCFDEHIGLEQLLPEPLPFSSDPPLFDMASVTKVIVPATLAMIAVDRGMVELETPLGKLIPGWQAQHERDATFKELLNHTSGLDPWYKYYEEYPLSPETSAAWEAQRDEVIARVVASARKPPGTAYAYSDLGYIAIMALLEELFRDRLDKLAQEFIFQPLGMRHSRYVNLLHGDLPLSNAVATEHCPVRGWVKGVVHDENTQVLGGVSGHAGVFGTAQDLARFADHLLGIDAGRVSNEQALVSRQTLQRFWSEEAGSSIGAHRGGWDQPSGARSSAGRGFVQGRSVGHLGFTGTSVWIERDSETIAVLLTNRVHPTRENSRILELRIAFNEAALPA